FSFDKEGQTSTGKSRTSFGVRNNNMLGLDDTLISGYSRSRNSVGVYAYHSMPVSPLGASLIYGYSYGESKPKKDFADWGFDSKAENTIFTLHQELFRSDNYAGEIYGGYEIKNKWVKSALGLVNRDKLRVIRTGGNFVVRGPGSSMTISPEVSNGIGAFAASSQGDPLVSRGAASVFQKLKLGIRDKVLLPLGIQENFRFLLQYATSKLTPQEEYSLGGLETVRGYPPDDFYADNAVNTSLEFLMPSYYIPKKLRLPYASKSLRDQITSVVFMDYGYGIRYGEDNKSHSYLSLGAGIRIDLYSQGVLRLEWGVPLGDKGITESKATRFHISIDIQESFPEEAVRIQKEMAEERIRNYAWRIVNDELGRPGSPLGERLFTDLYHAETLEREGDLKEAKTLYQKIDLESKSVYAQSEAYVRSCISSQQELKDRSKSAMILYENGRIEEARNMWQGIVEEAKLKSLTLKM
ncbi:MAG: ShlB/FhaC/HecB family hemolysin secretion/activation protein, partial [Candidatus Omnitrophota bacterium]